MGIGRYPQRTGITECRETSPGGSFRRLLEAYTPPIEPGPIDHIELLERRLDAVRRAIGSLHLTVTCDREPDERWRLSLVGAPTNTLLAKVDLTGVTATIRPLSLATGNERSLLLLPTGIESSNVVTQIAVTPWFAVRLVLDDVTIQFVIRADLIGAPGNREDAVLASLLTDRASLIRFLLLLMGSIEDAMAAFDPSGQGITPFIWNASPATSADAFALLEPLLRTAARDPKRLGDIARIMHRLAEHPQTAAIIPADWAAVWEPIREALGLEIEA